MDSTRDSVIQRLSDEAYSTYKLMERDLQDVNDVVAIMFRRTEGQFNLVNWVDFKRLAIQRCQGIIDYIEIFYPDIACSNIIANVYINASRGVE